MYCHGKTLVLHQLQQTEISSLQPVVNSEFQPPSSRELPLVAHLHTPGLLPPGLTECQRMLPFWKMSVMSRGALILLVAGETDNSIAVTDVQIRRYLCNYIYGRISGN
jgi:hypothetical protein